MRLLKFTVEYLEVFLLVMVRISAMVYIMPFFGDRSIPVKVKIAISFFLAVLVAVSILPMSWLQASAATEKHPDAVTITVYSLQEEIYPMK